MVVNLWERMAPRRRRMKAVDECSKSLEFDDLVEKRFCKVLLTCLVLVLLRCFFICHVSFCLCVNRMVLCVALVSVIQRLPCREGVLLDV